MSYADLPLNVPFKFLVDSPEGGCSVFNVEFRVLTDAEWGAERLRADEKWTPGTNRTFQWGACGIDGGKVLLCRLQPERKDIEVRATDYHHPERAAGIRSFRAKLLDWLERSSERVHVELSGEGGGIARCIAPTRSGGEDIEVVLRPALDV